MTKAKISNRTGKHKHSRTPPKTARKARHRVATAVVRESQKTYAPVEPSKREAIGVFAKPNFVVAAGQVVALNRKFIDIAKCNISASFDLAADLARAKNFAEIMQVQSAYWRRVSGALLLSTDEKGEPNRMGK